MADNPHEKPPIFVTGNPRSGTTLMRELLSAHPNIYITHEPWFYVWNSLCPEDVTGDRFLEYYFNTFSFRWLRLPPSVVLKALPKALPREDLYVAFREIMYQKAAELGRTRYGEKTPANTDYLGNIYRDFPDAKVVIMIRDPRSTVDSTRRMVWGSQSDLANCIAYERSRIKVDKFKDRVLFVKLEDLRLKPETEMRRVLEFVGEPWDDAVLHHAVNNPAPGDMPPVPWLRSAAEPLVSAEVRLPNMTPRRVRLIETVCRSSMKRFGYERSKFEDSPGIANVAGLFLSDLPQAVLYLSRVTRLFGRLKDPKSWRTHAIYIRMYDGLNPRWWRNNADIQIPTPPELIIEEPPTPRALIAVKERLQ